MTGARLGLVESQLKRLDVFFWRQLCVLVLFLSTSGPIRISHWRLCISRVRTWCLFSTLRWFMSSAAIGLSSSFMWPALISMSNIWAWLIFDSKMADGWGLVAIPCCPLSGVVGLFPKLVIAILLSCSGSIWEKLYESEHFGFHRTFHMVLLVLNRSASSISVSRYETIARGVPYE